VSERIQADEKWVKVLSARLYKHIFYPWMTYFTLKFGSGLGQVGQARTSVCSPPYHPGLAHLLVKLPQPSLLSPFILSMPSLATGEMVAGDGRRR
jgi:hypothetical protein